MAREFASHEPSLAVAGGIGSQHREALELCAAVHLLNYVAGNVGRTVRFGAGLGRGEGYGAIERLFARLDQGQVAVAIVHEANPLYALPKSGGFTEKFAKAGFKVSTANVLDETAMACDLVLPNLHALERWDDVRPAAGVVGLMQPVMEPVYPRGCTTGDLLLQDAPRSVGGAARQRSPPLLTSYEALPQERSGPAKLAAVAPPTRSSSGAKRCSAAVILEQRGVSARGGGEASAGNVGSMTFTRSARSSTGNRATTRLLPRAGTVGHDV